MSTNVLVIPEDPTKDQYILKPLVEKICEEAGLTAQVEVCKDPNFHGISGAMDADRLNREVIARYSMVKLFLLIVDRDGVSNRGVAAQHLQDTLSFSLRDNGKRFFVTLAWQEVEIFILAGHDLGGIGEWREIRNDPDVKNTYFKTLVTREKTADYPYEGRKKLMAAAIANFKRILTLCPEDAGQLLGQLKDIRKNVG
jgi:hypothetical protein